MRQDKVVPLVQAMQTWAAAVAVVVGLAGCPQPECETDQQCPLLHLCVDDVCVQRDAEPTPDVAPIYVPGTIPPADDDVNNDGGAVADAGVAGSFIVPDRAPVDVAYPYMLFHSSRLAVFHDGADVHTRLTSLGGTLVMLDAIPSLCPGAAGAASCGCDDTTCNSCYVDDANLPHVSCGDWAACDVQACAYPVPLESRISAALISPDIDVATAIGATAGLVNVSFSGSRPTTPRCSGDPANDVDTCDGYLVSRVDQINVQQTFDPEDGEVRLEEVPSPAGSGGARTFRLVLEAEDAYGEVGWQE